MTTSMTHDIFRGWKTASSDSKVEILGRGRVLDLNMKVRVDGDIIPGSVLGNPMLVWAPVSLIDDRCRHVSPGDNMALWQNVNCRKLSYMKSIRLFLAKTREGDAELDEQKLHLSFLACGLRMIWGYRTDVATEVSGAFRDFCRLSGVGDPDEFWGRGVWRTLPAPPPKLKMQRLSVDGFEIGNMLRHWHDDLFNKFYLADAWPIAAGKTDGVPYRTTVELGLEVHEVLRDHKPYGVHRGSEAWRSISRDELERAVWTHPRQYLAKLLGVSDMAIIKRCRRELISAPPRGFWQKIRNAPSDEMYMFLIENDTIPPVWWNPSISRNRPENFDLDKGVSAVSVERDSIQA